MCYVVIFNGKPAVPEEMFKNCLTPKAEMKEVFIYLITL
jgi:hypothetical protein